MTHPPGDCHRVRAAGRSLASPSSRFRIAHAQSHPPPSLSPRYEDGQIWCTDDLLPEGVTWADVPKRSRHVIVCGNVPDLYHFILPLRSKKSNNVDKDGLVTIVVITPSDISTSDWHRLSIFPQVYFVKGSPLYREDLLRAGVPNAQQVVVFPPPKRPHDASSIGQNAKTQMETEAMADADTLFINSALHSLNPDVPVISELVHFSNIAYLDAIHVGDMPDKPPTPTGAASPTSPTAAGATSGAGGRKDLIPPWFAAGNVYVSSLNDVMSAQVRVSPKSTSEWKQTLASNKGQARRLIESHFTRCLPGPRLKHSCRLPFPDSGLTHLCSSSTTPCWWHC